MAAGKKILYGKEAREQLKKGVDGLANAVKVTLGPRGRNVLSTYIQGNTPKITKDGVSVTKEIIFWDEVEQAGSRLVSDASEKTAISAGDGTSTSVVLAQEMITLGMLEIDRDENPANPVDLKKGMEKAMDDVIKVIKDHAVAVKSDEKRILQVATISANGDEVVGKLIAKGCEISGANGNIICEEGQGFETTIEGIEGYQIDSGYLSPFFENVQGKPRCELINPIIFLYDKVVFSVKEMLPILEIAVKANRPLLIISEDIKDEALMTILQNVRKGSLKCCAIYTPQFGALRKSLMEDLATVTGGTYFAQELGTKKRDFHLQNFGTCEKAIIDVNKTILIKGGGDEEAIKALTTTISELIENTEDQIKEFNKTRLARIQGTIAILKIGGVTEVEMKEKRDRIDDAICATKAAMEEGIVTGGGSIYIQAIAEALMTTTLPDKDVMAGYNIVKKAISRPFYQMMDNAGISKTEQENAFAEILRSEYGIGYNVKEERIENLLETGVIDPAKVARIALISAVSIASTFLTTECVISNTVPDNLKK